MEQLRRFALFGREHVLAGLLVEQRLVHVHGAAGFTLQRFGHERGVNAVTQRRFAHGAFEQEHLISEIDRIAVQEVHFHLAGAVFVDQRVDVQLHRLAVVVHVLEQRIELVDRVDAVTAARGFRATAASNRRLQRVIRISVLLDQIKLDFRRHHRLPALQFIELEHALEHAARRQIDRRAVAVEAVVDHLGGRFGGPRHEADRFRIRRDDHVDLGRVDHALVIRPVAGNGLDENTFRQAHTVAEELVGGNDLAARHAGDVRHQAFHFGNAALLHPGFQMVLIQTVFAHGDLISCRSRQA